MIPVLMMSNLTHNLTILKLVKLVLPEEDKEPQLSSPQSIVTSVN